jgi:transcriptional regulator with XRE-family HTH domain
MKPTSASPGARALAASLRELRTARGKGLRDLARMVRILPQLLSAWEKGQRVASPENVARLLGALQVDDATYERMMRLAGSDPEQLCYRPARSRFATDREAEPAADPRRADSRAPHRAGG